MPQQRRVRGSAISGVQHRPEDKRVLENLGDANLANRGVSLGTGKNGTAAGKTDSVYVTVSLDDVADKVYTFAHALGRVPAWATKWELTGPTSVVNVVSDSKSSWTKTTLRVRVVRTAGSLAGARLTLLVGG
jgi:uncharacterized membrane protein